MVHTIIVEDDPMVTQINHEYINRLDNFVVDATFGNGQDALVYLRDHPVDLAILDVYMPIISGNELLRRMRAENINTAVIMVTAATEMDVVHEVLRLGITDYLIKPFSFPRFQEAIQKYLSNASLLNSKHQADQSMVDQLLGNQLLSEIQSTELQKGLNQKTLSHIYAFLRENIQEKHTCESISSSTGLSKVTVRRYLNHLIEIGQVLTSIDYETGGRPRVLYLLK